MFGNIVNLFKPKQAQPQSIVLAPNVLLKTQKWVMHLPTNRVGIIADIDMTGTCIVHIVDERGVTIGVEPTAVGNLRIARYEEIPQARRPESAVYAATLGYF